MLRIHPLDRTCSRVGALLVVLAITMLTVAVPIAVALDANVLEVDGDAELLPEEEATPLPEPEKVVEDVKKTVSEVESTIKETVNPSDPSDPSDPGSEPGDPSEPEGQDSEPTPSKDSSRGSKNADPGAGGAAAPLADTVTDKTKRLRLRDAARRDDPRSRQAVHYAMLDGLPAEWWGGIAYAPGMSTAGGPRDTHDIVAALGAMDDSVAAVAEMLAPFPVAGIASYSDDFGAPRDGGERSHAGTDIFADHGTPVIASADGRVTHMRTGTLLGGTSLRLTEPDGTFYYYAHLDRFAPGMDEGEPVAKGDVLGYMGNTGNAVLTPPHLHYEIHPRGGGAVDPVPYLDRWLAEARARLDAWNPGNAVAPPVVAPPVHTASVATPPVIVDRPEAEVSGALAEFATAESQELGVGVLLVMGIAILLALVHGIPALVSTARPN